jgi:putative transposase
MAVAATVAATRQFQMTAVCEMLGVARSNIARRVMQGPSKRRGRPALSEEPLLSEIMTVIAEMPSYGYPRVWAVLRRGSEAQGDAPANRKRVYRIMKKHGLLLQKHAGGEAERQHDGCVAVGQSNLRGSVRNSVCGAWFTDQA